MSYSAQFSLAIPCIHLTKFKFCLRLVSNSLNFIFSHAKYSFQHILGVKLALDMMRVIKQETNFDHHVYTTLLVLPSPFTILYIGKNISKHLISFCHVLTFDFNTQKAEILQGQPMFNSFSRTCLHRPGYLQ